MVESTNAADVHFPQVREPVTLADSENQHGRRLQRPALDSRLAASPANAAIFITARWGKAVPAGPNKLTKSAQEPLWASDERLRSIVENVVDGIITIDESGVIQTANAAAERIFGYPNNELIGRNVAVLMPEPFSASHDGYLANYLRGGSAKIIGIGREVVGLRRDGTTFPLDLSVGEFRMSGRRYFTGVVRDITARKRAESALRESEGRFRALADNAPVLIWISGTDKRCTWFNKRWLDFTGRNLEQECGDGWVEGVHVDDLDRCLDTYVTSFDSRVPFTMEYRLRRHDGEYRNVLDTGTPLADGSGRFAGYIGSCIDITDRIRSEEALRDSERIYRAIGESIPYGVWICDADGRNTYASESFLRLVGQTQEQYSLFGWANVLHPDDSTRTIEAWKDCLRVQGVWDFEHRFRGTDGRWHPILARGVPVRDDSGRIICWAGINLDIGRLKETEEALRRREQEFQTLAENSPLIISRFDLRFRHIYINRAIERITGRSRERFIGRTQRELGAPEDYCALWEGKLLETIETQLEVDFEFSYAGPLGERAFYSRLVPEFSSDGLIVSILGVCSDVTERKALQAEVLSIAEREQQRIGQDLHDDVGQELTGVGLMAEALVDALQEIRSPEAELAAKIRRRLEHARERIRTLASGLIPVELDARGLMSALEDLCVRIGMLHGIESTFTCKVAVQVDDNRVATQLYRITQEAIANAIKHSQARRVDVELRRSDGVITLEIRDDGVGILEKSRRGSGMGLRIMQYRAGLLGAALEVGASADGGTSVVCRISGGLTDVSS